MELSEVSACGASAAIDRRVPSRLCTYQPVLLLFSVQIPLQIALSAVCIEDQSALNIPFQKVYYYQTNKFKPDQWCFSRYWSFLTFEDGFKGLTFCRYRRTWVDTQFYTVLFVFQIQQRASINSAIPLNLIQFFLFGKLAYPIKNENLKLCIPTIDCLAQARIVHCYTIYQTGLVVLLTTNLREMCANALRFIYYSASNYSII